MAWKLAASYGLVDQYHFASHSEEHARLRDISGRLRAPRRSGGRHAKRARHVAPRRRLGRVVRAELVSPELLTFILDLSMVASVVQRADANQFACRMQA